MFNQSLTCAVLIGIKKGFMSYKTSVIYNLILHLAFYVKNLFLHSLTRNYIVGEPRSEKKYQTSLIYNAAQFLLRWFLKLSKRAYKFFEKLFDGSAINALFSKIHAYPFMRFEYFLGAFFALMMITSGSMWNNAYAVIAAFGFSFLYYGISLSGRDFGTNVKALPVSLVAFVVAILGGVMLTPVRSDGIRIALFFISAILFALLIWGSMNDAKRLKAFLGILVGALFVMCLYAIYQNYVGVPVDILLTDVNTNSGMPGRVYSTFDNPNNFAEAIVLILPFVYALIFCSDKKISKLIFLFVFAICAIALAMSYSRSCYVAFAIATFVFALLYDWRLLIPLGIIVLLAIPFLPASVTNRILTIGSMQDSSNAYRTYLWDGVLKLVRHTGVSGIGIGPEAFAKAYPPFASYLAEKAPHSHMLYLELLLELGVVGVLGFLTFMFSSIKKGLATYNRTNKDLKCIIIASISALSGISFTACAEYIWFYPRVMFVFWVVVGILLAAIRCAKKKGM